MEPREQDQKQTAQTRTQEKPRRFRIVKLEERIAPTQGGNGTNNCGTQISFVYCAPSQKHCGFNSIEEERGRGLDL